MAFLVIDKYQIHIHSTFFYSEMSNTVSQSSRILQTKIRKDEGLNKTKTVYSSLVTISNYRSILS